MTVETLSNRAAYAVAQAALAAIKPGSILIDAGGYRERTASTRSSLIVLVRRHDSYQPFVTWELIFPDEADGGRPFCSSGTYHAELRAALDAFDRRVGYTVANR